MPKIIGRADFPGGRVGPERSIDLKTETTNYLPCIKNNTIPAIRPTSTIAPQVIAMYNPLLFFGLVGGGDDETTGAGALAIGGGAGAACIRSFTSVSRSVSLVLM